MNAVRVAAAAFVLVAGATMMAAAQMPAVAPTPAAVPVATPAVPLAARAPGLMNDVDRMFVLAATQGNNGELITARLALARSQTTEVRSFAQQMIDDHTMMAALMRDTLGGRSATPDPPMNVVDTLAYGRLEQAAQVDFDQLYLQGQIGDHLATIAVFDAEANGGSDPTLRAMAAKALPMLRDHLALALGANKHVGGDSPFKH